ncbi:MAG: magnesium/cobalt transporter CorA [Candidatus Thermoplasmatota archaeon]
MKRFIKEKSNKIGLPPGSLLYVGDRNTEKTTIKIIDYDKENFLEKKIDKIEECFDFKDKSSVSWINIDGIYDTKVIEKIGKKFDLHPLILEDILNTDQRPKMEDFENYIFIVFKMLQYDEKANMIVAGQVSLILGEKFVISFQEQPDDVFESIRDRIRNGKGHIRSMKSGYLAYCLIDAIVDNYFLILEKIGEKIEEIENKLASDPNSETLTLIYNLKREMIFLRKSVWPLRELISNVQRSESEIIQDVNKIYLKDLYDHTIQVIDTVESFRDMISGLLEIYLSTVSNKMNEVMKVLTVFAALFIPLTFIVGIYGMNFEYMPELYWKWSYPVLLFVIISIISVMLYYFKRKSWL